KNKGAGRARNVGLKHASGKWLLFLDADDFFTEGAFDVLYKHISSSHDIIFFRMTSCYSDTFEEAERHESYCEKIDDYFSTKNEYELRCKFASPWAKMIRSQLV